MIGIDIVSIARIRTFIERFGENALRRFLSKDEMALCLLDTHYAGVDSVNISRVAGFWAAKEACAKALGVGIGRELGFLDIYISKTAKNAPNIKLDDKKMATFMIKEISLSISHDGGFAIAAVFCASCG